MQMLEFDEGYYSIACCPYPSQGGGGFLCGRGTRQNQIAQDFSFEEREVDESIVLDREKIIKEIKDLKPGDDGEAQKLHERKAKIERDAQDNAPPKHGGNLWKIMAEGGWRPRGWFDQAYPAIGEGSIVPTDWCVFGATLLNYDALAAVYFTGYSGAGSEGLFIVWNRWKPRGLRLCAIAHVPCDHIVRTGDDKKIVHTLVSHEQGGEAVGHLRREFKPFYQHSVGEKYSEKNDGKPSVKQAVS